MSKESSDHPPAGEVCGNQEQQSFSMGNPFYHRFNPQPDVTAWDIAIILRFAGLGISEDFYSALPVELSRHFSPPPDSSGIVDNIQIFYRAFLADEIYELYSNQKVPHIKKEVEK